MLRIFEFTRHTLRRQSSGGPRWHSRLVNSTDAWSTEQGDGVSTYDCEVLGGITLRTCTCCRGSELNNRAIKMPPGRPRLCFMRIVEDSCSMFLRSIWTHSITPEPVDAVWTRSRHSREVTKCQPFKKKIWKIARSTIVRVNTHYPCEFKRASETRFELRTFVLRTQALNAHAWNCWRKTSHWFILFKKFFFYSQSCSLCQRHREVLPRVYIVCLNAPKCSL